MTRNRVVALVALWCFAGCGLIKVNGKPLGGSGGGGGGGSGGGGGGGGGAPARGGGNGTQASADEPPARGSGKIFPDPPPAKGELADCPSQDVLSRMTKNQRTNKNGSGYYIAEVGTDGQRYIPETPPAYQWSIVMDRALERAEPRALDEQLGKLWGYRCAYWNVDFVKRDLERVRKVYLDLTGIEPEVERRLHMAMIDPEAVDAEIGPLCPRDASSTLAAGVCMWRADAIAAAYANMDAGEKGPLAPAAVVAACRKEYFDQHGALDYVAWRLCELEAAKVDRPKIEAALKAAKASAYAQAKFLASYDAGVVTLAALEPAMRKIEKGYPNDKLFVDESIVQVDTKYMPMFKKWNPTLKELDAWYAAIKDGPAYAEGCEPKFTKLIKKYVATVTPKPVAEDLLLTLRDPIGYRLVQALAVCHVQLENADRAAFLQTQIMQGGDRVRTYHEALWSVLQQNSVNGYKGKKVSHAPQLRLDEPARDDIGALIHGGHTPYVWGDEVVKLTKQKGMVEITYKTYTGVGWVTEGCHDDFNRPRRIDEWGRISYDQVGCHQVKRRWTKTEQPVLIPADEAAFVKVGMRILAGHMTPHNGEKTTPAGQTLTGRLIWAKKGEDIVWAAPGVAAK